MKVRPKKSRTEDEADLEDQEEVSEDDGLDVQEARSDADPGPAPCRSGDTTHSYQWQLLSA